MKLRDFLKNITDTFNLGLDMLFIPPKACPLCRTFGRCKCREALLTGFYSRQVCPRCGKFTGEERVCSDCVSRGRGFPERVYALAPYKGEVRQGIHDFKYRGNRQTGRFLAELLWDGPGREVTAPDVIIPVPLHTEKQTWRGFNQAQLLAEYLGNKFNLTIDYDVLVRVLSTRPQSELTREQRKQNLSEAFECSRPERVQGKRVLLVDDIITTGYTLEACGTVLRAAGAKSIEGICLAAGLQNK